ncbi:hypothetical protein Bca101_045068 [Brassica carinata]
MKVSTEVEENPSESTLSKAYKLVAFEKQSVLYNQVATRCICTLLDAEPHFSYRDNLLSSDVRNIISPDEVCNWQLHLFGHYLTHLLRMFVFTGDSVALLLGRFSPMKGNTVIANEVKNSKLPTSS